MKYRSLLLIFLTICLPFADKVDTLTSLVNVKVQVRDDITESEGRLFYFNYKLHIDIHKPLNQKMIFSDNLMKIFYPDENKAFIIKSPIIQMMPAFSIFLMTFEPDMGLTTLGFKVGKIENKKDGKTVYFVPDKTLKKIIKHYIVKFDTKGNPVYLKAVNSKNETVSETFISEYKFTDNQYYPTYIKTVKYDNENVNSVEEMILSSTIMNGLIPNSIKTFKIPEDAEIKEVER